MIERGGGVIISERQKVAYKSRIIYGRPFLVYLKIIGPKLTLRLNKHDLFKWLYSILFTYLIWSTASHVLYNYYI